MKKKTTVRYACDICGEEYETAAAAKRCEAVGFNPVLKVGDIVFCKAGFGWFDGDERWVENVGVQRNPEHGNCFGECCTMRFYYVVTAVDGDVDRYAVWPKREREKVGMHRPRYHLLTAAMSGKQGYRTGYTFDIGHYTAERVEPEKIPDFVRVDSLRFIGQKATCLI